MSQFICMKDEHLKLLQVHSRVSAPRQRPSTTPLPPPPLWASSPFRSIASKGLFRVTPFVPTPINLSCLLFPSLSPSLSYFCFSSLHSFLLLLHLAIFILSLSLFFFLRFILPSFSPPAPQSSSVSSVEIVSSLWFTAGQTMDGARQKVE